MNVKSLFLVFFLISFAGFSQKKNKAEKLYDLGNVAFAKQDYKTADSLFTLSLDIEPHPDAFYNRAVCKRKLSDFKNYCVDMSEAANMYDQEAFKLYWKDCAKADTIYKKNDGTPATKADFEIAEFPISYKYKTDYDYERYDSMGSILLSKMRSSNVTIYRKCKDVTDPKYRDNMDSLTYYLKIKTNIFKHIIQNNLTGISNISFIVDENGKISEVKLTSGEMNPAITELINTLSVMPDWKPAIYNDKAVKFLADVTVSYYDTIMSVSLVNPSSKVPHKYSDANFDKSKDQMPEFPGGIKELMMFIGENIVYPQRAKENGISGKCLTRFVIMPNGKITNIQIVKGVPRCKECDDEAIRVIKLMPAWKPGINDGKPVPVFFNLPVNFQLR